MAKFKFMQIDLEKKYNQDIQKQLSKEFGNLNLHAVSRITKIVLNVGVGKMVTARRVRTTEQKTDEEMISDIIDGLSLIAGQRPHIIRARKSIASFKLREGMTVGLHVTLRHKRMYDFLGRLIHVALPRTRDFRGISEKSVDKDGNLTLGLKEASIFPELPPSNINWSFEVTIVTSTRNREQALELFKKLGIPFKKV